VLQGAFRHADPSGDGSATTSRRPWSTWSPTIVSGKTPAAPARSGDGRRSGRGGPVDSDAQFLRSWREELLSRAWACLEQVERGGGQPYYSILRFRAENQATSSARWRPGSVSDSALMLPYGRGPAQGAATCPRAVRRRAHRGSGAFVGQADARAIGAGIDRARFAVLLPLCL